MRMRLAAVLLLAACYDGLHPGEDLGAVPFYPPLRCRVMCTLAQECSGRVGDFDVLSWWVVPGAETFEYDDEGP